MARNNDRLICMYSKIYVFQCMCNIFNIFNKTFSVSSLKVLKILNLLLNISIQMAYSLPFPVSFVWKTWNCCGWMILRSSSHLFWYPCEVQNDQKFFELLYEFLFCSIFFFFLQWLFIILLVASSRNKRWDSGGPFLLSCCYRLSQFRLASELTRQSICDSN